MWCESLVWVIMGRRGVSQNAGVLVVLVLFCHSFIHSFIHSFTDKHPCSCFQLINQAVYPNLFNSFTFILILTIHWYWTSVKGQTHPVQGLWVRNYIPCLPWSLKCVGLLKGPVCWPICVSQFSEWPSAGAQPTPLLIVSHNGLIKWSSFIARVR